jgi:hypothetical protein
VQKQNVFPPKERHSCKLFEKHQKKEKTTFLAFWFVFPFDSANEKADAIALRTCHLCVTGRRATTTFKLSDFHVLEFRIKD